MVTFLYNGTKLEYLSSIVLIVFHTVILKMLEKGQKPRNVDTFLNKEDIVSIIDRIPHSY